MATPNAGWQGFQPTGYRFLVGPVRNVVLQIAGRPGLTAGELLVELLPQHYRHEPPRGLSPRNWSVETDVGRAVFRSDDETITLDTLGNRTQGAAQVIGSIVQASNAAKDDASFGPLFFLFDSDRRAEHQVANFFVVNNDRIVVDNVELDCCAESGFNPECFELAFEMTGTSWRAQSINAARVRLLYKSFYETTRVGQLVDARHDVPTYHYRTEERGRAVLLETTQVVAQRLKIVQHLLTGLLVSVTVALLVWLM
jgi:hypothetical protein